MTREEAIKEAYGIPVTKAQHEALQMLIPELKESEGEKTRKSLIKFLTDIKEISESGRTTWAVREDDAEMCKSSIDYLERQKEQNPIDIDFVSDWLRKHIKTYINSEYNEFHKAVEYDGSIDIEHLIEDLKKATDMADCIEKQEEQDKCPEYCVRSHCLGCSIYEKQKEKWPIKIEVYEIGKGTTICGQDYKCKKDYKTGTCWYIKDVIYHCSRDGYLNDQNGVSWSCTPEWFNEYIYSNKELADKEKNDFVSGQFLQCKLSFGEFKEGEHYWLEYVGDDMYVGRSDNVLNQKFHITPRQLYTLFSQQLDEKQKEQKPILEVFGFKVGDAVRLKDGDGRKHIIKSFEEVEGLHGPNFYHVEFEDNSARDGIYPGEEYPNGYYTQMEKFEEEQKPVNKCDGCNNARGCVTCVNGSEWEHYTEAEQKPVEPSDDELQRHLDELYDFQVFVTKQAKEHNISFSSDHDFEWHNFCAELLSYLNEKQKPVEWSKDFDEEVEKIHKRYPEVSFAKLTRIAYHFSKWATRYKDIAWTEDDETLYNNVLDGLKYAYEDLTDNNSYDTADCVRRAFEWMKYRFKKN